MSSPIPPFEVFYAEQRGEVLGLLRRLLGAADAEDAYQETFLRALQAYERLDNGDNLRAWILTIARNVATDMHRRSRRTGTPPEPSGHEEPPAFEQLAPLTAELPPTERAAVVLRYGYDLPYETIAAALGSTPTAARQAASSGVRRLRGERRKR